MEGGRKKPVSAGVSCASTSDSFSRVVLALIVQTKIVHYDGDETLSVLQSSHFSTVTPICALLLCFSKLALPKTSLFQASGRRWELLLTNIEKSIGFGKVITEYLKLKKLLKLKKTSHTRLW